MVEEKVYLDLDLQENQLKNARVPDIEESSHNDEDAINRKYVHEKTILDTELSKLDVVETVGGIIEGTQSSEVDGKGVVEILDMILYPLIEPVYEIPTITTTISNFDDIIKDTGFTTDIVLEVSVDINDSESITNYTFSGMGITGTITQESNIFVIKDYILLNGYNTWSIGIEYSGAVTKQNTHGEDSLSGYFPSGSINNDVVVTASYPMLYSVRYGEIDATITSSDVIPDILSCVLPVSRKFDVVLGNNSEVSFNFAIPSGIYDTIFTINDIDVTNSFKQSEKVSVTPWGVGVGSSYDVYHWFSNLVLDKPTIICVELVEIKPSSIYELAWNNSTSSLSIDGGVGLSDWDNVNDNNIPDNDFSIKFDGSGIRIVSTVGNITKVEKSRPFMIVNDLNSNDVTIPNEIGSETHESYSDLYNFRVWVD